MRSCLLRRCCIFCDLTELWSRCIVWNTSKRALYTRGLIGLNRAEVIASSLTTMVNEIAMAERLLEVRTRFRLKIARGWPTLASAWA